MSTVALSKPLLREAIFEYIIQSRTGAVASYQATAAMSVDDVADSSTEHLWSLIEVRAPQGDLFDASKVTQVFINGNLLDLRDIDLSKVPPGQIMELREGDETTVSMPLVGSPFTVAEDLAQGQVATFNEAGQLVAYTGPATHGIEIVNGAGEHGVLGEGSGRVEAIEPQGFDFSFDEKSAD